LVGERVPIAASATHDLGLIVSVFAVVDETVGTARSELFACTADRRNLARRNAPGKDQESG
jgi:hypothetical protein